MCATSQFWLLLIEMPPGFALTATLWLRVAPARLERVGEELSGHAEVAFAAAISGDSNVMAVVICRDTEDLYRYLTVRIGALDGVRHLESAPIIRTFKRSGNLLV